MDKIEFLEHFNASWQALLSAFQGLSPEQMKRAGVTETWSVKDILGHVTTWEQEALQALPDIQAGKPAPDYLQLFGGIDGFNAYMVLAKNRHSLDEVLQNLTKVHEKLLRLVEETDPAEFADESPFLLCLRANTTDHYPEHTQAILDWRARNAI